MPKPAEKSAPPLEIGAAHPTQVEARPLPDSIAEPLALPDGGNEKSQTVKDVPVPQPAEGALEGETPSSCSDEAPTIEREALEQNNQELFDSALDYCQASNDFWEQGDLDNALDALDKAYSLILKVDHNNHPEVLQQKEDLRFTISKRIIEVYSSRFTVANGYHKAIPLVMNDHVEKALSLFKGRERGFFLASYRRSGKYRPAIAEALKDAGLPEELSWLPLIESGFNVRALSRARALGLWQFIASTGYKFGLKRDRWIDERMDPERSTQAAIAYLKELHKIFGDWTTVLAAYNCGEGTVLKRIRTQRVNYLDNFWDLYTKLPRETAFYVPKFMAVLHIIHDPEAHGFSLPPLDKPIQVERVPINKQVHLRTIATRLDIDYKTMKELNAELRHYLTPNRPYQLKVPSGHAERLIAELDQIPVYRPPTPKYVYHRVRPGESLSVIANRYRTSVRAIMDLNNLKRRNYVRVGWKLKIPTKAGAASGPKKTASPARQPRKKVSLYVVRKGDSLWKIANRYGTTTKAIRSFNRLQSSTLQIGQTLRIPVQQASYRPEQTKAYRVRKGDSPYLIAKRHQMNLAEFLKINCLTPRSTIFPGQSVIVRAD
jgi:membrane-bound lytic murein transglycosylase D